MKKADYLFRFVALVLIVTLVIQLIPIECYATGMVSADDTVETVLAESDSETAKMSDENKQLTDVSALREEPMILSEVTDLREEKVKHFFNHDGSFSAVSYLDPVHFELNGKYEDIDNTLMSSVKQIENRKESGYIPKQSPVDVFFMDSAVNEDLVYLTDRGYQISWTYLPEENKDKKTAEEKPEEELSSTRNDTESGYLTEDEISMEEKEDADALVKESDGELNEISEDDKAVSNPAEDNADEEQTDEQESADESDTEKDKEMQEAAGAQTEEMENQEKNDRPDVEETIVENPPESEEALAADFADSLVTTDEKPQESLVSDRELKANILKLNTFEKLEGNEVFLSLPHLSSGLIYENIGKSADLEYFLNSVYLKENLILRDRDAGSKYQIRYHIGSLHAKVFSPKEVALVNDLGEVVFSIFAPFMEDGKGAVSDGVFLELLSEEKGEMLLQLTVDEGWLQEKDRAYPVRIDPYIFQEVSSHDQDATALYQNAVYPYGSLYVGNDNGADYGKAKGYIRYTLPQLSAGDIITGGWLNIVQYPGTRGYSHVGNPSMRINAYKVTSDWTESSVRNSRSYSNLPSAGSLILDYKTISTVSDYEWRSFNISRTVKEWYEGAGNYGICLRADDQTAWAMSRFITSDNPSFTGGAPALQINYRNNKGLEDYWTYHVIDLGQSGAAYINDYSGNLVIDLPGASTPGNRMPVSVNLVFNGHMAAKANSHVTKCGSGWQLSLQETLTKIESGGSLLHRKLYENGYRYIYADGDGTEHYLCEKTEDSVTKVIDEDGLDLTLTVYSSVNSDNEKYELKRKDGSRETFNLAGNLRRIYDSDGNYMTILYSTNVSKRISSVTDGAGRRITFSYDSDNRVTGITDPAGRVISITYQTGTDTSRLNRITYPDGTYTSFSYSAGRVTKIRTRDLIRYQFTYPDSTLASVKNRVQTVCEFHNQDGGAYVEANAGKSLTIDRSRINRTKYTDQDGRTELLIFDHLGKTINVKDASGGSAMYRYRKGNDPSRKANTVESAGYTSRFVDNLLKGHSFEGSIDQWTNSQAAISTADGTRYLGNQSVCISPSGYVNQKVEKSSGTYTFSTYVKGQSSSSTAKLAVYYYDSAGSLLTSESSQELSLSTGFTRISYSFTVPSGTVYFRPRIRNSGNDEIYADCAQLEKGKVMNAYNLVTDGGFERPGQNAWSMSNCEDTDGYDEDTSYGRSAMLEGDEASNKRFYQKIIIGKAAKNLHFSVSGMGYASSASLEDDTRTFGLAVRSYFTDGTNEISHISFNEAAGGIWQYVSGPVGYKADNADKTVDYIYIYCTYYKNANKALFDHIQVNLDETGSAYTYDNKGNLITAKDNAGRKQTYDYTSAGELAKAVTEDNKEYTFTYDSSNAHRLKHAVSNSSDIRFSYTYDSFGNVASEKISSDAETGDASGKYIRNSADYSTDGAYQIRQGDDLNHKDETVYDEDTGRITSYQDREGNVTSYSYQNSNDLLTSVTGPDGETVSYTYDSKNYLTRITSPSMVSYGFSYDHFGKITGVSVGNRTLVSHQYAPGDGGLQSSMYGNGDSVAYSYDDLDRVTAKSENGSRRYTWDYNADGQVGNHSDLVNGKDYRYSYDEIGRLTRTDISDGSWFQNDYNTMDLSTGVRYHFSGVTREINYGYSERDYLPASTSITSSRVVSNGYDTLGRLTERSYTTASQPVTVSYDYRDWTTVENRTTGIVNHVGYSVNGGTSLNDLYYVYDRNGNITQVRAGSTSSAPLLEKYTYDSKDQLVRHDSSTLGKTYSYSYDAGGNITWVCEYNYTTGSLPDACLTRKEYSYGDAQWKDLLTGYNGSTIRYDEIGNMISFNGRTYSWNGRKLEEITNGEDHYSYAYNANGIRTSKTVNGITTEYFLNGDQVLAEKTGDDVLWYFYDAQGQRIGLMRNNTSYYYLYDLTGNVIALVKGSSGNVAATYTYDAWGNCTVQNVGNETIGTMNPFRYKGYYYDRESGFHYVSSRYYYSEVGRFLNTDAAVGQIGNIKSHNMYGYAFSNPVMYSDPDGNWPKLSTVLTGIAVGAAIVAAGALCVATVGLASVAIAGGGSIMMATATTTAALHVAGAATKVAAVLAGTAAVSTAVEVSSSQRKNGNHTVYKLVDGSGKAQYVGRTTNLQARKNAHKANPYRAGLDLQIIKDGLSYEAARGIEQTYMLYHHTINTKNKMNNQINGISPNNQKIGIYINAAKGVLGYTWNQVSNEILYWSGN